MDDFFHSIQIQVELALNLLCEDDVQLSFLWLLFDLWLWVIWWWWSFDGDVGRDEGLDASTCRRDSRRRKQRRPWNGSGPSLGRLSTPGTWMCRTCWRIKWIWACSVVLYSWAASAMLMSLAPRKVGHSHVKLHPILITYYLICHPLSCFRSLTSKTDPPKRAHTVLMITYLFCVCRDIHSYFIGDSISFVIHSMFCSSYFIIIYLFQCSKFRIQSSWGVFCTSRLGCGIGLQSGHPPTNRGLFPASRYVHARCVQWLSANDHTGIGWSSGEKFFNRRCLQRGGGDETQFIGAVRVPFLHRPCSEEQRDHAAGTGGIATRNLGRSRRRCEMTCLNVFVFREIEFCH